jgi:hypothetical protein
MKSEGRQFWHFRPSHHAATGLLTREDVDCISQPGRRILSVGAYPAFLERLLPALGVPYEHILLADKDPSIKECGPMQTMVFDAMEVWPDIGTFDRIVFPESLCVSIGDRIREEGVFKENAGVGAHQSDVREAELLAALLYQAIGKLRPGGMLRANGPMSHPAVLHKTETMLHEKGISFSMESRRFFLAIRVGVER